MIWRSRQSMRSNMKKKLIRFCRIFQVNSFSYSYFILNFFVDWFFNSFLERTYLGPTPRKLTWNLKNYLYRMLTLNESHTFYNPRVILWNVKGNLVGWKGLQRTMRQNWWNSRNSISSFNKNTYDAYFYANSSY